MVGIRDIAKKAGVSISTVSYALNGSDKVTEETRQRIEKIANEMNYVPNMAAKALKRRETKIIGVYLSDYLGSFYGELLDGIKHGLQSYDYEMIVCSGKRSHLFIPERMVDGVIILDWTFETEEIQKYGEAGYKLVTLDREVEGKNLCHVLLDNVGGATLAVEKMMEQPATAIHLVTGPENSFDSVRRLEAAENELKRYGKKYTVHHGDFDAKSGRKIAESIYLRMTTKPISIFSFNDEMVIGMYDFFKRTELEIGKDVNIIGFDNAYYGNIISPTIASISFSKKRWGMVAVEKLMQLINNEETTNDLIYTSFVPGQSFSE
ncbi:LacI family DNA-binding transcriptional regulator [Vagococcus fluvialis]|uniref:LacI family transcriptional regulator n=1 Tax=Vagococcus fluvialis TaxID=2738 RepID=A0A369AWG5_9ENTE|nr:LacI family DNA-binding transcriptional regulator [Vagococcus fluvialis]RCX12678.1 LacI family transcriptional regulator [Vagococcus fluvialis]RSU01032.1 LacI family transcriptional regulator [Vagococcus fluvialis]